MRTVASLVGSATSTSISAIGLNLASAAREEPVSSHAVHPPRRQEMTEVATFALPQFEPHLPKLDSELHRSFSTSQQKHFPRRQERRSEAFQLPPLRSEHPGLTTRRGSGSGSGSLGSARGEQTAKSWNEGSPLQASINPPGVRPQSWLRRLSSSMASSRDSSQPPSRPASTTHTPSNASVAFSHADSTTPVFGRARSSQLPPNKLVKRASSVRSTLGSPSQSPGSRLPLPVFKRPATSHQRSATMQDILSDTSRSDRLSLDAPSSLPPDARDTQLRHYFTPRIAADEALPGRRRNSTGIPNPIKRIYPDRKYKPVLVSSREGVKRPTVQVDDRPSSSEQGSVKRLDLEPNAASSPLTDQSPPDDDNAASRRSFSIGDWLPSGPQPLWRRPSSGRSKATLTKSTRRTKPRNTSVPATSMGGALSNAASGDTERPAKRRDLTDPSSAGQVAYTHSTNSNVATQQSPEIELSLGNDRPHPQQPPSTGSPFASISQAASLSQAERQRSSSAASQRVAAPNFRVSGAQSEVTLSTIESESDRRSTGGFSTDYQSDTVYDSFPTRTTRSSSGKRGPPIDTIFDESPPLHSGRSTKLGDLLSDKGQDGLPVHSTIEEEGSTITTPVRSIPEKNHDITPPVRSGAQQLFLSSPPAIMPDPDEIDWDAPDEGPSDSGLGMQQTDDSEVPDISEKNLSVRFGAALSGNGVPTSVHSTPVRNSNGAIDRTNPFDWSEMKPSPSYQVSDSPPRPRTVHGKKEPDQRGSRAAGRRAPSGMHSRSHSVPIVPDVDGKRSVVANKFGTWGVGSKGVTEDWNEDFDFEEDIPPVPELPSSASMDRRVDSGNAMRVPRSIREQQDNVMANISLLREWGLAIEELKDLKMRAVALDMLKGPESQAAWQEVDAMIELADQESEEDTLQPRRSPPSSPGFDFSAFDEPVPELSPLPRPRVEMVVGAGELTRSDDAEETSSRAVVSPEPGDAPSPAMHGRPRKDSAAVARSVIEALQSKRVVSDPSLKPAAPTKKVPFDTATLRHIVPYVNGLKRQVKDALREAEGLYISPIRRQTSGELAEREESVDQSLRSIFDSPQPESPTSKRLSRREQAVTDRDEPEATKKPQHDDDLTRRMHNLSLPTS
ncbi:hypothetical protein KC360_g8089 [Hortaea werneckii]|nr:hypothetical protein KC325_g8002 [Hortaea werneckii]KAI6987306.1 hypothetical protein KC359_g8342 [Hortaea werneckii]KAI7143856.1 hypothetical protein KC344_g5924 [Hortaea werneckii]KAI7168384.1 hypothetical protein KC360_g8089 [Hortaea werneckii]